MDKVTQELCDIFYQLKRRFEIIHANWGSDLKFFEAKVRTQIPRDSDDFNRLCDEWVDLFSEVTNTVWAKKISNTGPKIRFRKQYQCWTQGGKIIQKELLFDARRCKATLDMKVLTDNPQTRRKNKHVRMGLNVVVRIYFQHLHTVDISQPFAFFVHHCEPQPDAPKSSVQLNNRLPELVAAMVQNGANISRKVAEKVEKSLMAKMNTVSGGNGDPGIPVKYEGKPQQTIAQDRLELIQDTPSSLPSLLHNMEPVKIKNQLQLQQCTQFIVSSSQFDEHFLMCPLIFDASQVITLNNQNSTPFVHLLSREDNLGEQLL